MAAQPLASLLKVILGASFLVGPVAVSSPPPWLSPAALVASPNGSTLYIGCATSNRVLFFDTASRRVTRSIPVALSPTGLCLAADGQKLFVTCAAPMSRVCVVDIALGRVAGELSAGHTATAPVLSPDGQTLFVCNQFDDNISVLNLLTGQEVRRIPVRREPVAAAITPDGRRLLVANHLPTGRADASHVAAVISVIDPAQGRVVDELSLPSGSGGLNDLRVAPDGKYAVVTHTLARFQRPTTQVERGWMNANALTAIALDRMAVLNTVLLDEPDRGAANPWGVAWSADGRKLVIAHAGTHEVSVIDFPAMLAKLAKLTPEPLPANTPVRYGAAASAPSNVPEDLSFLASLRERRPLPAGDLGPRAVVVVGRRAYTANYFSDRFGTPTLIELWRTAPYLHDGSVPTLRDLLTLANPNDRHGTTSHLTADQIMDLCEYLLSL